MKNHASLSLFLLVALVGIVFFFVAYYGAFFKGGGPFVPATPGALVETFGSRLQYVSLTAAPDIRNAAMDEHYAPYVASSTLAAWKADPSRAPGRVTSSPWPDHIEIDEEEMLSEDAYRIEGRIIEVTSETLAGGMEPGSYPVIVMVMRIEDRWQITSFERAVVSAPEPQAYLVMGIYECLPHKGDGPHTLECAFGLQTDDGAHYALDFSAFTSEEGMSISTGERIRITGTVTALAELSEGGRLRMYDIQGVIHVMNAEKL